MRAALLVAALFFAPLAHAESDACKVGLGRGWPPATESYGTAVENLFAGDAQPALSFTLLPQSGTESGVLLIPGVDGGPWMLRRAVADERVHMWSDGRLELRTQRPPGMDERSIPEVVAMRLLDGWREALSIAAPNGSGAPFDDDDAWVFRVADPAHPGQPLRVSGLKPACELGALLRDQIGLLIEASDEGDEKREKRWRQLGESLDRMHEVVAAMGETAAN